MARKFNYIYSTLVESEDDFQGILSGWEIVQHLHTDKFGNSWLGVAEKETKINEYGN